MKNQISCEGIDNGKKNKQTQNKELPTHHGQDEASIRRNDAAIPAQVHTIIKLKLKAKSIPQVNTSYEWLHTLWLSGRGASVKSAKRGDVQCQGLTHCRALASKHHSFCVTTRWLVGEKGEMSASPRQLFNDTRRHHSSLGRSPRDSFPRSSTKIAVVNRAARQRREPGLCRSLAHKSLACGKRQPVVAAPFAFSSATPLSSLGWRELHPFPTLLVFLSPACRAGFSFTPLCTQLIKALIRAVMNFSSCLPFPLSPYRRSEVPNKVYDDHVPTINMTPVNDRLTPRN